MTSMLSNIQPSAAATRARRWATVTARYHGTAAPPAMVSGPGATRSARDDSRIDNSRSRESPRLLPGTTRRRRSRLDQTELLGQRHFVHEHAAAFGDQDCVRVVVAEAS